MSRDSIRSPQHADHISLGEEPNNSGASQSHGVVMACDPSSLKITQYSQNYPDIFTGFKQDVLGANLSDLIGLEKAEHLKERLQATNYMPPQEISICDQEFMMHCHLSDVSLIIDFEPLYKVVDSYLFQRQFSHILTLLKEANSELELCKVAGGLMQELFGYDRNLVCRFDEDWNGEVIAESKVDEMQSLLGLYFPAADLPEEVRELFMLDRVRMIANAAYKPAAIIPSLSPINNKPLDISKSQLKPISPFLIKYHKRMNLGASLTASIVINNKLWGIIICHHREAKLISHYQRENCRFLTEILASEINLLESQMFEKRINRTVNLRKKLITQMRSEDALFKTLSEGETSFTDFIDASGGALYARGKIILKGITPTEDEVRKLFVDFVMHQKPKVFGTKHLASLYPEAEAYSSKVAGLLAVRITNKKFIVWFRQEAVQVLNFGGDLNMQANSGGINKEASRKETIIWSQKVSGQSKKWEKPDFNIATTMREDIRSALVEQQYGEISTLYDQLREANQELELFSFGLSHDLKAPLRGIQGYLKFFKEDFADKVGTEGLGQIETIIDLTHRMRELIDDILSFSSLKVHKLSNENIEVRSLIDEILLLTNAEVNFPNTKIICEKSFPRMFGDKRLLFQLWSNLIGNALKYSSRVETPEIEIGHEQRDGKTIYYVKDNGIGLKEEFHKKIFEIFVRVSGGNYNGTGIGLAITKRIAEKHGGTVWVESEPNKGATFYFYI